MKFKILIFFIALLILITSVQAYCPPYFAHIDSIEPIYPCLDINDDTRFCGGSISIVNNCNDTFYYYDDEGNIDHSRGLIPKDQASSPNFRYFDYPYVGDAIDKGPRTDVRYWTIKLFSENNQQEIVIKGRTIYERSYDQKYIGMIFSIIVILSLLGGIVLLLARKIFKKNISNALIIILFVVGIVGFIIGNMMMLS